MAAITTAIIAGAAIAGTAAVATGVIASSGAKKAAQTQADAQREAIAAQERAAKQAQDQRDEAVRLKQEAAKNINFPTFLEIPEAQQFKQTIEDRIAGRGLIDVNAQTAPVAQQVRAGERRTLAASSSALSAAGLGRSTLRGAQAGEISQAAERDIASRVSQLELARQDQISQAVSEFGRISEQEARSQQAKASFQQGAEFNIADTVANNANQFKSDQFAIADSINVRGATEAAFELKSAEIWASALVGLAKSADDTTDDIINAIEREQDNKRLAAQVAIS